MLMAELTASDVADHIARSPRVLVPVGSTEQHGSHAPLGTDAFLATEVCKRVAARTGAVVAPAIPFGVSPEHEGFAGLISLTPRTMMSLVREVCVSLSRTGFKSIVLINGHYTNVVALHAAIAEASEEIGPDTILYWLNYWDALPAEQKARYLGDEVGFHANIGETSAVLAVDNTLVHMEKAEAEYPAFPRPVSLAAAEAYFFSGRGALRRALPSGVWGDPRKSTVEAGRIYLHQIEDAVVKTIAEVDELFRTFGTAPART
jgi:creatinine amidohydrolase